MTPEDGDIWSDRAAFVRLWRAVGKAVWAAFRHREPVDSHRKGKAWEADFEQLARGRGLAVEPGEGRVDMKVAGLLVQCKACDRLAGRSIDVANMRPVAANGGLRGYMRHEVDVLALRHAGGVFLIPADRMVNGDGTLRGRVRVDEIEQFRDAWGVFDADYVAPLNPQRSLFGDLTTPGLTSREIRS